MLRTLSLYVFTYSVLTGPSLVHQLSSFQETGVAYYQNLWPDSWMPEVLHQRGSIWRLQENAQVLSETGTLAVMLANSLS